MKLKFLIVLGVLFPQLNTQAMEPSFVLVVGGLIVYGGTYVTAVTTGESRYRVSLLEDLEYGRIEGQKARELATEKVFKEIESAENTIVSIVENTIHRRISKCARIDALNKLLPIFENQEKIDALNSQLKNIKNETVRRRLAERTCVRLASKAYYILFEM